MQKDFGGDAGSDGTIEDRHRSALVRALRLAETWEDVVRLISTRHPIFAAQNRVLRAEGSTVADAGLDDGDLETVIDGVKTCSVKDDAIVGHVPPVVPSVNLTRFSFETTTASATDEKRVEQAALAELFEYVSEDNIGNVWNCPSPTSAKGDLQYFYQRKVGRTLPEAEIEFFGQMHSPYYNAHRDITILVPEADEPVVGVGRGLTKSEADNLCAVHCLLLLRQFGITVDEEKFHDHVGRHEEVNPTTCFNHLYHAVFHESPHWTVSIAQRGYKAVVSVGGKKFSGCGFSKPLAVQEACVSALPYIRAMAYAG